MEIEDQMKYFELEVERLQKVCRQKDERIEFLTRDNAELVRKNEKLLKNMETARKRLVYLIENEILPLGE